MNLFETAEFSIDVVGEDTGEKFFGTFTVLKRLTHSLQLKREAMARELLGPNPENASPRSKSQASVIADLRVSIVKGPDWLKASNYCADLCDDNILTTLDLEIDKVRRAAEEEVRKRIQGAKETLKTDLSKE